MTMSSNVQNNKMKRIGVRVVSILAEDLLIHFFEHFGKGISTVIKIIFAIKEEIEKEEGYKLTDNEYLTVLKSLEKSEIIDSFNSVVSSKKTQTKFNQLSESQIDGARGITLKAILRFDYYCSIERVLYSYKSEGKRKTYIRPYMDLNKVKLFVKNINKTINIDLPIDDVLLLIDETLFGDCEYGIAITYEHLIISKEMIGSFELKSIKKIEKIRYFLRNFLKINFNNNQVLFLEITQGDVNFIVEVVNKIILRQT